MSGRARIDTVADCALLDCGFLFVWLVLSWLLERGAAPNGATSKVGRVRQLKQIFQAAHTKDSETEVTVSYVYIVVSMFSSF